MNFEFLSGAVMILFGLLITVFRSKFVDLQKRQASMMKTPWSKQILEKGKPEMERNALIIGLGFAVIGIVMIANTYGIFN